MDIAPRPPDRKRHGCVLALDGSVVTRRRMSPFRDERTLEGPVRYGRHTGHADLLREMVDGLVGEDPPPGWRARSSRPD